MRLSYHSGWKSLGTPAMGEGPLPNKAHLRKHHQQTPELQAKCGKLSLADWGQGKDAARTLLRRCFGGLCLCGREGKVKARCEDLEKEEIKLPLSAADALHRTPKRTCG